MEINKYIDHTNLKNNAIKDDIKKLCEEAIKYSFKSVCVYPYYVSYASQLLKDSDVLVCTVIGFPSGMSTTETKVFETRDAISNGADEIDMVINISALKNIEYNYVKKEIESIKKVVSKKVLKVIIETCLLSSEEIIKITQICNEVGVDFIKTSTGFSIYGARIEDVELINDFKKDNIKIKASGGIKTYNDAIDMINAGAGRIGTSSSINIINENKKS